MQCEHCQTQAPDDARFCMQCGASLVVVDVVPERRQLTVAFIDLVDSTELSQQLDAEDYRELLATYQRTSAAVVERYDGWVAQYLGDGILVYFGYPQAHEDDPTRAVEACLEVLSAMAAQQPVLTRQHPALGERVVEVRAGVHTGAVVVGDVGVGARRAELALGDTVNLTFRLLDVAKPGQIVITEATRRLTGDRFRLEDQGASKFKGIAERIQTHRVLGMAAGSEPRPAYSTPLVGRDQEVALLQEAWSSVKAGTGRALVLSGEPGMGKSRLLEELRRAIGTEPHVGLEARCSPYHQTSALHPVVGLLEQALDFAPDDAPEVRLSKLERGLADVGLPALESVALLADLIGLRLPDRFPALPSGSEARRQRTLEVLATWLVALAKDQPVVLAVEDLHWSDPSTLDLLGLLMDRGLSGEGGAAVLMVMTHRPNFSSPWRGRPEVAHLTLNRLTREQSVTLANAVALGHRLPQSLLGELVEKTDGVALYVEELTKGVIESGLLEAEGATGRLDDLAIPSTLQGSLTARLDRLGSGKAVAQLGAVLGREFGHELLASVYAGDACELADSLERLAAAELLYCSGEPPLAQYTFKHALIRDAAYRSLLNRSRQEHHLRVAQVLEERFPEVARLRPEVVAQHYGEARRPQPAIEWWERAATRAAERSAHAEALVNASHAIELMAEVGTSASTRPASRARELGLQLLRGGSAIAARGHSDAEVERSYSRARELCGKIDDAPLISQALVGLSAFSVTLADLDHGHELALQLLEVAERCGKPPVQVAAHLTVGIPLFFRGEPGAAAESLERAIALYDPGLDNAGAYVTGQDPGVVARSFCSWAHWLAGAPDRALARGNEAIALAREIGEPFNLAFGLAFSSVLHCLRGEPDQVQERADELIPLASDQGFPLWRGYGHVTRGWALAREGEERGVVELEQGIAQLATTGVEVARPQVVCLFAEALAALGRPKEALSMLEGAGSEQRQNRFWDAEILRLSGEIGLQNEPGSGERALTLQRRALATARKQGAASFALRAALGVARSLEDLDRALEGRALLIQARAEIRDGGSTGDVRAADALLTSG